MAMRAWISAVFVALVMTAAPASAQVGMGKVTLPGQSDDLPVTVFLPLSEQGLPKAGNGRLIVISHGSGAWYGVYTDLARALVDAGYVVAFPQHAGDRLNDDAHPGPDSWKRRPEEVSHAIDAVAADAHLARLLKLDRVGVYGMSAGGHTALTLAGGAWSPSLLKQHCDAHLAEDFQTCVGLVTSLNGNWLDGLKLWLARRIIDGRLTDTTRYTHVDPRIAAVAAAVPLAADFDLDTLAKPRVPLAILTAGRDVWLVPRFHADRVLAACLPRCEHLVDMPDAGHGAYLSPLPPNLDGLLGRLINDPVGFDRAQLTQVHRKLVDFFDHHLRAQTSASIPGS